MQEKQLFDRIQKLCMVPEQMSGHKQNSHRCTMWWRILWKLCKILSGVMKKWRIPVHFILYPWFRSLQAVFIVRNTTRGSCIKVIILVGGWAKQFAANQNVKYKCFHSASQIFNIFAGSVHTIRVLYLNRCCGFIISLYSIHDMYVLLFVGTATELILKSVAKPFITDYKNQ